MYALKDQSGDVCQNLTSFWYYMPFTLGANLEVTLRAGGQDRCYVAVLLDGEAWDPQPKPVNTDGMVAGSYRLEVSDANHGTIEFKQLHLVRVIRLHRNNEWAELRVYQGHQPGGVAGPPPWIDATNWMKPPDIVQPDRNHWKRSFDFGGIQEQPIDESVIGYNNQGEPRRVTLVRRLIQGTISDAVIAVGSTAMNQGDRMPSLTFHCKDNGGGLTTMLSENFLTQVPIQNRAGFTMIAAGAFAAEDADMMLSRWTNIPGPRIQDTVCERLGQIVWAPSNISQGAAGGRLLRKLNNVHDTDALGAVSKTGLDTDPVEVLHVECSDNVGNVL